MIDWWGLFRNSLWVIGLAGSLAALSMAGYQARAQNVRLRKTLDEPGFQVPFSACLALTCLALLLSGRTWWEKALWGALAALFAAQGIWRWYGQESRARSPRPESPPSEGLRRRIWSTRSLGRGFVLAGLIVLFGWTLVTGVQLVRHASSVQSHLQRLEQVARGDVSGLGRAELQTVGQHLAGMQQDLEAIDARVGPLLDAGRWLRWIPEYGGDLAAASDLLEMAVTVSAAGARTVQALSPAMEILDSSEESANPAPLLGERLLPLLTAAQPELQGARQQLVTAGRARAGLDVQTLSPRIAELVGRLDRYLPWLETALDGALLAPTLLGADEPHTYLILAQNNYELRATGGFISGVGELQIDAGRISPVTFHDSYTVDNFEVPHDLTPVDFQRTLYGDLWLFRDANWDADYPTSAQRALDIYARDRGVQADHVIALDLVALQLLVDAIAPLQVEGIDEPVTGENVVQVIQEQWGESFVSMGPEHRGWVLHRKDFMGQIAHTAMNQLLAGKNLRIGRLVRALKQALDEKHILLYLTDPQAARLVRQRNWDGALVLPSLPSDALLVADSNVGFNKMDARVVRSISYQVDLSAEDGPRARVTLTYQNRGTRPVGDCVQGWHSGDTYADMMERCYWDYVRVYVPAGSHLLVGPDLPLPSGSLLARNSDGLPSRPISPALAQVGWAVWAAFFDLPTMEERTLMFDYQLPSEVLDLAPDGSVRYHLRVRKQPGTDAVPLRVEITLPPGAELVAAVPAGLPVVDTDLRTDREFEILFREREEGP
jgi:hypothetical protein